MNSFFIAGQAVDTQMGLGVMNVIDPLSKVHIPIVGQIEFLIAVMIFLSVNGPYYTIRALLWSYEVLPISELNLPRFGSGILRLSADMWRRRYQIHDVVAAHGLPGSRFQPRSGPRRKSSIRQYVHRIKSCGQDCYCFPSGGYQPSLAKCHQCTL